jgi:ribosomal protein S18 acetylase RimI-like enzyme
MTAPEVDHAYARLDALNDRTAVETTVEARDDRLFVSHLLVPEQHREQGAGRRVLAEICTIASETGFRAVEVNMGLTAADDDHVDPTVDPSTRFLRECGFTIAAFHDGQTVTAYWRVDSTE